MIKSMSKYSKFKCLRFRIPVKTGRNLAAIVESAAMNFRATQMGYDAKVTFNSKLRDLIQENRGGTIEWD